MGLGYEKVALASGAITDIGTTQLEELGAIRHDANGYEYEYTKNEEASVAFAVGDLVVKKVGTSGYQGYYFVSSAALFGTAYVPALAVSAIAAGGFGWVQKKGIGTAHISGTVAVGDFLKISTTNKKIDKATISTDNPIGLALAAGTNADKAVWLYGGR